MITVDIKRSNFDSARVNQGDILDGTVKIGDTAFWFGWSGLNRFGQNEWWPEAKSLWQSAFNALKKFEAEKLGHNRWYVNVKMIWNDATKTWLVDADEKNVVEWSCGGNGYGTSRYI